MNRKQRRMEKAEVRRLAVIPFKGKMYTVEEAGVLAANEKKLGNLHDAAEIYKAVTVKHPSYAEAYSNYGVLLHELGKYEEALKVYDEAIALKPDFDVTYNNRGNALQELKRYKEALDAYDVAIQLNPNASDPYNNRGNALQELKFYEEAVVSYDRALAINPLAAEVHNNRGAVLQKSKRYDEALASYIKATELKPDYVEAYHNLGVVYANKGEMERAEKAFLFALTLRPMFAQPLFSLLNIRKYKDASSVEIKHTEKLLKSQKLALADREQICFALGKAYDDCDLYDKAFEAYQEANEIKNKEVAYNRQVVEKITQDHIAVFTKEFLSRHFPFDSNAPIFVVGMPRSGTTLIASMLSNHPKIGTAGELPTLTEFTLRMPQFTKTEGYPEAAKNLSLSLALWFIGEYERRLKRDIPDNVPFIIDKHPLNFRHLGLIAMLFPKSHIIHCTRDPFDTCLSNYFQRFTVEYDYCFDLGNTGHFYRQYAILMEHWKKVLPVKMIDVSYEDMVSDTEGTERKALEFLGLEWDANCLTPHTNKYAVETASHWQVRQPIYNRSVGRWKHYEKYLAPLKKELAG